MAGTEIIDLDKLIGKPKKVRLGGKVYTLPAQIPVPLYLLIKERQKERLEKIEKEEEPDDVDVVQEVHRQVLELFQIHHPEMKVIPCGMGQLMEMIPTIYPPRGGGEAESPPPSTRARNGSGSSTRKRTTKAKRR